MVPLIQNPYSSVFESVSDCAHLTLDDIAKTLKHVAMIHCVSKTICVAFGSTSSFGIWTWASLLWLSDSCPAQREDWNIRAAKLTAWRMPFKLINPSGGSEGAHKRKMAVEQCFQKLKVRSGMQGRVDICVYKVSNDASKIWRRFEGISATLWQVRCVTQLFVCNK